MKRQDDLGIWLNGIHMFLDKIGWFRVINIHLHLAISSTVTYSNINKLFKHQYKCQLLPFETVLDFSFVIFLSSYLVQGGNCLCCPVLCCTKLISTTLTKGIQKAIPQPLGSSRSQPAPHEGISWPTCLPGWCTSSTGTRPCRGVGVRQEPGTSSSLRIRFSSWDINTHAHTHRTHGRISV